jgi:hypothetical protein
VGVEEGTAVDVAVGVWVALVEKEADDVLMELELEM